MEYVIEKGKGLILFTLTCAMFLTDVSGQYDQFFKELGPTSPQVNDMSSLKTPQRSTPARTQRMLSIDGFFLPLADHSAGSMADNPFSISDWALPPISADSHIYSTEPKTPAPEKLKLTDGSSVALAVLQGSIPTWKWSDVLEKGFSIPIGYKDNFYGMACCQRLPYICNVDGLCTLDSGKCEAFCECVANPHAIHCLRTIPRLKKTMKDLEKKMIMQTAKEKSISIPFEVESFLTAPDQPEKASDGKSMAFDVLDGRRKLWQWDYVLENLMDPSNLNEGNFYGMECCQRLPYICGVDGKCLLEPYNKCERFCECTADPHASHCRRTVPRLKQTMRELEKKAILQVAMEQKMPISPEVENVLMKIEEAPMTTQSPDISFLSTWMYPRLSSYSSGNPLSSESLYQTSFKIISSTTTFSSTTAATTFPSTLPPSRPNTLNYVTQPSLLWSTINSYSSSTPSNRDRVKYITSIIPAKIPPSLASALDDLTMSTAPSNVLKAPVNRSSPSQFLSSSRKHLNSTALFSKESSATVPTNAKSSTQLSAAPFNSPFFVPQNSAVMTTPTNTISLSVSSNKVSSSKTQESETQIISGKGRIRSFSTTAKTIIESIMPGHSTNSRHKPHQSTMLSKQSVPSTTNSHVENSESRLTFLVLPSEFYSTSGRPSAVPSLSHKHLESTHQVTTPKSQSSHSTVKVPTPKSRWTHSMVGVTPPKSQWEKLTAGSTTPKSQWINSTARVTTRKSQWANSTTGVTTPRSQWTNSKAGVMTHNSQWTNTPAGITTPKSQWTDSTAGAMTRNSQWTDSTAGAMTRNSQWTDSSAGAMTRNSQWTNSTATTPRSLWAILTTGATTPKSQLTNSTVAATTPKLQWMNSTADFHEETLSASDKHKSHDGELTSVRNVSGLSCAGCEENGGVCVLGNDFSPHCVKTFTGDACEHFRCIHGSCISTDGFYSCECFDGWTGTFCDKTCALHCGDNGFCGQIDDGQTVACVCHWNYTGERCDQERAIIPHITEISVPGEDFQLWQVAIIAVVSAILLASFCILLPYWLWRRQWLPIRKLVFFLKDYEDDDGKEYDAFISYKSCPRDERFVLQHLYPKLEKGLDFRLCLHFRDFPPGTPIANNIIHAIENSRRTILILSPSYVKSEWCRMEYQKAQHEMLRLKHKIIPIILEDIDGIPEIDQNLKTIIDTVTYIKWPGEVESCVSKRVLNFWKRLELSMPKKRAECGQSFSSCDSSSSELSLTHSSKTCFNSLADSLSNLDDCSTSTFSTQFKWPGTDNHTIEIRNEQNRNSKRPFNKTSPLTSPLRGRPVQNPIINDISYRSWLSTCNQKLSLSDDSTYLGSDDKGSNSSSWSCQSPDSCCDCATPLKPHLRGNIKCSHFGEPSGSSQKGDNYKRDRQHNNIDSVLRDARENTTFVHNDDYTVQIINLENKRK